MKILYVSQYYPPEMGAPAARVSELARYWVDQGHDVTVLTGFPNHPTGRLDPAYRSRWRRLFARESMDGVDVVRSWLIPLPNRKAWERVVGYSSFCISACLRGMFLRKPDVVIATSPQLLVGLVGWWIRLFRRVPFVFEVRDLWPDAILASGVGREGSAFAKVLRSISGFLYRTADHVVVVTPAFQRELESVWRIPGSKMSVIPNGVDVDLFKPMAGDPAKRSIDAEGRFVVSYIGTFGLAHGLDVIADAAAELSEKIPEGLFLLVGAGADLERLQALIAARGLTNVRSLGERPRASIPEIVAASDVCLVLLKRAEVFKTVIPTKMLEVMASGRPVILGVDGQAREILEESGGGIFIEPEDPHALVAAIEELHSDRARREQLGSAGRAYIEARLSRRSTADAYIDLLHRVSRHG